MLAQLQQLTCLEFGCEDLEGCPAPAYSALTSSTRLQVLDVWLSFYDPELSEEVWQHIFLPSKQLLHLVSLGVHCRSPALDEAAISSIAKCCPALQNLSTSKSMPYDLQQRQLLLVTLRQLTGLTKLSCDIRGDADTGLLAQLTGLQGLKITDMCYVTAAGLQRLTALQQLSTLGFHKKMTFWWCPALKGVLGEQELVGAYRTFTNKVSWCFLAIWPGNYQVMLPMCRARAPPEVICCG